MSEVVSDVIWAYYFQKFPAFIGSVTVYDHLDYLTCLCYALLFRRKWSLSIQTLSLIFLSVYSPRLSFSLKHMLEITKVIFVLQARKFEELKKIETRSYCVCSMTQNSQPFWLYNWHLSYQTLLLSAAKGLNHGRNLAFFLPFLLVIQPPLSLPDQSHRR